MHVIGTAGHVDHGKSTLVKALTGMDPDRFEEEKRRGLTIDLGFAWFALPSGRDVGVVDVPGHERFIRNMLAGVGGIDAAVFVVAADEGWMPQSAEHLQILDFLQVRAGIVAVTKIDAVEPELVDLAVDDVRERTAGTVLDGAAILPVSSVTGDGLEALRAALDELLSGVGEAADHGRPRLFVDRSFTITGAGTVVTGTLSGGSLRSGEEVELLPSGLRARIRNLQTHREQLDTAVPGSRVAVNLVGIDRTEVARGEAVVRAGQWQPTDTFAARLWAARDLDHAFAERGAYELYVGSAEVPCRVKFLEEPPPHGGRLPALAPGADLLVQAFCMRPVPVEPNDRFIIRDVGRWETVAGGVVLDHAPGRIRREDARAIERLRAREQATGDELLMRVVSERKLVPRSQLGPLSGLGPGEVDEAVARATTSGRLVATPTHVLDRSHADDLARRATAALRSHHDAHRLEPGMPREALRRELDVDAKAFAELLDRWAGAGTMVAEGATVRLPDHGSALSEAEETEARRVLGMLRSGGASPPMVKDLGTSDDLLRALERRGDVVRIGPEIAYASDVMDAIERDIVELITRDGPATVAEVRDTVGTSRKYAVPLLEHLDGTGLTRRDGDTRVLGPRGRAIAGSE